VKYVLPLITNLIIRLLLAILASALSLTVISVQMLLLAANAWLVLLIIHVQLVI
jgi:hypothetical protein